MYEVLARFNVDTKMIEELLVGQSIEWGARLLKAVIILVLARVSLRFGQSFITRLLNPLPKKPGSLPEGKTKTVQLLVLSIWQYVIYAVVLLLLLSNFGLDIGPILAGAGILGLAVGFGAQNLVRDIITGFFIIFESQFSVGDYITSGEFSGIVEELGLRITKVRDFSGDLHIIPNSKIEAVTNRSRGNMRALVDVGIAYEEDIDQAIKILEELAESYAQSDSDVVEGPTVLGVHSLADSAVVIRLIAGTLPMTQWKVERNLRRAIKNKFDEVGIEIPYPRLVHITREHGGEGGENG